MPMPICHSGKPILAEKPRLEVADIFRLYGLDYRRHHKLPFEHHKVMKQIEMCRTAAMGGHIDECNLCGFRQNAYNSCGNRHCPKCRAMAREQWLAARKAELLPVGYFHNVFTLPHDLNPVLPCNMKPMLDMLFAAVNETLQAFAADPQWRLEGRLGFIAVLHTWSRTLMNHFHLHCLIPGGALSFDRTKWTPSRKKYLFRKDSMAKEFKKRYLRKFEDAYRNHELIFPGNTAETGTPEGFSRLVRKLRSVKWVAYAKRPFAGPAQVLEYLGRYTHRVAISNNRIRSIDDGKVTFTYRDRMDQNAVKEMALDADEFIRRFLLHVLPKGFMKIRYFGYLFHRDKKPSIALIRNLIDPDGNYEVPEKESVQEIMLRLIGLDITRCPSCGKGQMVHVIEIPKGSPPANETRGRCCRSP